MSLTLRFEQKKLLDAFANEVGLRHVRLVYVEDGREVGNPDEWKEALELICAKNKLSLISLFWAKFPDQTTFEVQASPAIEWRKEEFADQIKRLEDILDAV